MESVSDEGGFGLGRAASLSLHAEEFGLGFGRCGAEPSSETKTQRVLAHVGLEVGRARAGGPVPRIHDCDEPEEAMELQELLPCLRRKSALQAQHFLQKLP